MSGEAAGEAPPLRFRAAVLEAPGTPLRIEVVECEPPGPGEVLVRVGAAGLCHTGQEVAFRWGSLMGEKRITRCSYGGAQTGQDFPLLVRAYLEGRLKLDELITQRIGLERINEGFDALRQSRAIRSVVVFDGEAGA